VSKTSRSITQNNRKRVLLWPYPKTYQNFGTASGKPWNSFQRAHLFRSGLRLVFDTAALRSKRNRRQSHLRLTHL